MSTNEQPGPTNYEDLYKAAEKELQSDNYEEAENLFAKALDLNNTCIEAWIGLANLHIKTEKFDKAQNDADKAIDIHRRKGLSAESTAHHPIAVAFLKGGLSCFHRGKYQDAKNYFAEGAKHDSSTKTGLNQWMIWCDEKMEKAKNAKSDSAVATAASGCSKTEATTSGPKNSANSSEEKKSSSDQVVANIPEQPKIKHDWYQTESTVVVEVRIKGLNKEQVSVEFQPRELNVSATIPQRNNAEYNLDIALAHEIQPERCTFKVLSTKLEIKMLKKDGIRWTVLEGEDPLPVPVNKVEIKTGNDQQVAAAAVSVSSSAPKPPYASKKDWSKIEKDIEKELESEKPEGEAALNDLFSKIYKDGDDNLRRAMNKSFQESGGTVLSTNWDEIAKEKTDVKPPDGMEYKTWDS